MRCETRSTPVARHDSATLARTEAYPLSVRSAQAIATKPKRKRLMSPP
jgi:hypothetical protein